uniref:Uncharacterized protein n=1 Tax=Romanomermis culicivorax TaxID=13658 RepID=A0A915L3L5_ROMCU
MALCYISQCLMDTRAPSYPATEERKVIIRDIHHKYQIEMEKKAEIKKRKDSIMRTKLAIPPKYQITGCRYTNDVRHNAASSCAMSADHESGTADASARHLKTSKTLTKVLPKG